MGSQGLAGDGGDLCIASARLSTSPLPTSPRLRLELLQPLMVHVQCSLASSTSILRGELRPQGEPGQDDSCPTLEQVSHTQWLGRRGRSGFSWVSPGGCKSSPGA